MLDFRGTPNQPQMRALGNYSRHMSWFSLNPEILVAIVGLIGGALGYLLRKRLESRENLKQSLYLMLEIWHRVTILGWKSHDQLFDLVIDRIKEKHGKGAISQEEIEAAKSHFIPVLRTTMVSQALEGFDNLHEAHAHVVKLVAKSDPVLAYSLESGSNTRKKLAFIDQYLEEAFQELDQQGRESAAFSAKIKNHTQAQVQKTVQLQIESDLKKLASCVSLFTCFRVRRLISKRKKMLSGVPEDGIDDFLAPIMQGVESP